MVAAAAARDFDDELTVIMSSLEGRTTWKMGIRRCPAQRCIWKSAGLLECSARRGVLHVAARLEQLLDR